MTMVNPQLYSTTGQALGNIFKGIVSGFGTVSNTPPATLPTNAPNSGQFAQPMQPGQTAFRTETDNSTLLIVGGLLLAFLLIRKRF